MLSPSEVQFDAVAGLVIVAAVVLVGRFRLPRRGSAPPPVASRRLLPGTMAAWLGGTLVATLWPIAVLLAPSAAYDWPALPNGPGTTVVQLLGIALGLSGGLLFISAVRALGVHMTPVIQAQEGHQLVQAGPYRWVRHPVYTAILAVSLGQTLLYLSTPLAALTVVLLVLAVYRSGLEEELLGSPEIFGAAYGAYKARTGRFLPRLRRAANAGPSSPPPPA
jgi:protein-S-isoprenylcysteine O-methyltransferase Ste14